MRKDFLVYVAGPYSSKTVRGVSKNVSNAIAIAEQITKVESCIPFIPHLFHWWEDEHPHEYEFWLNLDFRYLSKSDILFRFGGESKGADAEVEFAKENNIPCVYSIEELNELVCIMMDGEYGNLYS